MPTFIVEVKDKSGKKIKEKVECECGGCYIMCHKSRHFKSKRHQNFINQQNNNPVQN